MAFCSNNWPGCNDGRRCGPSPNRLGSADRTPRKSCNSALCLRPSHLLCITQNCCVATSVSVTSCIGSDSEDPGDSTQQGSLCSVHLDHSGGGKRMSRSRQATSSSEGSRSRMLTSRPPKLIDATPLPLLAGVFVIEIRVIKPNVVALSVIIIFRTPENKSFRSQASNRKHICKEMCHELMKPRRRDISPRLRVRVLHVQGSYVRQQGVRL